VSLLLAGIARDNAMLLNKRLKRAVYVNVCAHKGIVQYLSQARRLTTKDFFLRQVSRSSNILK
jgi:hypothetical protein